MRVLLETARGNWGEELSRLIAFAAELDPQNADLLSMLGHRLKDTGRIAEAERMLSRAWAVSQTGTSPHRNRSTNHLAWTGDTKGALDILEAVPERLRAGTTLFFSSRASVRAVRGEIAAALADYEQVSVMVTSDNRLTTSGPRSGNVLSLYHRAQLEARRGRRGEKPAALAAIDEAMQITAGTRNAVDIATMRQVKAEVLTVLGQTDAAIAELRAVHEMGYGFGYLLRVDLE